MGVPAELLVCLDAGTGGTAALDKEDYLSLVVRKPVFGVYDQVQHKPGCTAKEF